MTGFPLTQKNIEDMGKFDRDSLVGRVAQDNSPMDFENVLILGAYKTPATKIEPEFYSIKFVVKDGREFTFHKEYTGNLGILPRMD